MPKKTIKRPPGGRESNEGKAGSAPGKGIHGKGPLESASTAELMRALSSRKIPVAMVALLKLADRFMDPATREETGRALFSALSGQNLHVRFSSANVLISCSARGASFSDGEMRSLLGTFSEPDSRFADATCRSLMVYLRDNQANDFVSKAIPFLTDKDERAAAGSARILYYFISFLTEIGGPQRLMHVISKPLSEGKPLLKASVAICCEEALNFMNMRLEKISRKEGKEFPRPTSSGEAMAYVEDLNRIMVFFSLLRPHLEEAAKEEEFYVRAAVRRAVSAIDLNRELCIGLMVKIPYME